MTQFGRVLIKFRLYLQGGLVGEMSFFKFHKKKQPRGDNGEFAFQFINIILVGLLEINGETLINNSIFPKMMIPTHGRHSSGRHVNLFIYLN